MQCPTVSEIKREYILGNNGYFFDRDTMSFFGDTMRSFGTIQHEGQIYLYRKPSSTVNVFGTLKKTGRDYFNCWEFSQQSGDLYGVCDEIESEIYDLVSHK